MTSNNINPLISDTRMKSILIYVSPTEFEGKAGHLKEFIIQNKMTNTWWNYVPFLWVVTSKSSVRDWNESLKKFIGDNTDIIVAEISAKDTTGFVNEGGWKAFSKDIRQVIDDEKNS